MNEDIEIRASEYVQLRGLELGPRLGFGKDGVVYSTTASTSGPAAIKVFGSEHAYQRELACYQRLRERGVVEVRGHHVPQLIAWDGKLLVIEMTIVAPPYLLDFAGAHLDSAPEYPDEMLQQWHQEKQDQFGARWKDVQMIRATLQGQFGVYLFDVTPSNIRFGDDA